MNVDREGLFSIRQDVLANGIDALLYLIPVIGQLNSYIKAYGRTQQAYKMLNGDLIRPQIEIAIKKYFTKIGLRIKITTTLFAGINTAFFILADFSTGKAIAYALGRIYKVEKRYAKKYVYWGEKVKVPYIVF